ncbi:hypothetical protein [Boudabousia marimammalium]|nr:hypothetical protein [Boudabousia marimammalium]
MEGVGAATPDAVVGSGNEHVLQVGVLVGGDFCLRVGSEEDIAGVSGQ